MPFRNWQSLAVKIPLLQSLLLLAALAAMTVASYVELQRALVDMASQRLQGAAGQMATVFGMSARQRSAAMTQFMRHPEIADYLKSRDVTKEAAIRELVKTHLGTAIEIG